MCKVETTSQLYSFTSLPNKTWGCCVSTAVVATLEAPGIAPSGVFAQREQYLARREAEGDLAFLYVENDSAPDHNVWCAPVLAPPDHNVWCAPVLAPPDHNIWCAPVLAPPDHVIWCAPVLAPPDHVRCCTRQGGLPPSCRGWSCALLHQTDRLASRLLGPHDPTAHQGTVALVAGS